MKLNQLFLFCTGLLVANGISFAQDAGVSNVGVLPESAIIITQVIRSENRMPVIRNPGEEVTRRRVGTTIRFLASSNGCTRDSDFRLTVGANVQGVQSLSIVRTRQDRCRARPSVQSFVISTTEVEAETQLQLVTPLTVEDSVVW